MNYSQWVFRKFEKNVMSIYIYIYGELYKSFFFLKQFAKLLICQDKITLCFLCWNDLEALVQ